MSSHHTGSHADPTAARAGPSDPTTGYAICCAGGWLCDPLDPDSPDDELLTTSVRRLVRLAIAASDTGARFVRDGLSVDPAAWLLTPRALFGGRPAVEACQELEHFNRSVVLHGVGLGLDADADAVDALLDEDVESNDGGSEDLIGCALHRLRAGGAHQGSSSSDQGIGVRAWPRALEDEGSGAGHGTSESGLVARLYSCWIDAIVGPTRVFAFCAVVSERPEAIVQRVIGRFGVEVAGTTRFLCGYDRTSALATAMISDAMSDTLALVASDPSSPLARGMDVYVEQRFVEGCLAA